MRAVADNSDMADEQEMTEPGSTTEAEAARKRKARDLNELVRYTMWSVFRVPDRAALEAGGLGNAAAEVSDLLDQAAAKGIVTRGSYDIQGLRADADYIQLPRCALIEPAARTKSCVVECSGHVVSFS